MPTYIPNRLLDASRIPSPDADWSEIERFALTFDGYKHCGGHEQCAAIANARRNSTMSELRTCLFFEQRRCHHSGCLPDEDDMKYVRSLIEQIRIRARLANDLLA